MYKKEEKDKTPTQLDYKEKENPEELEPDKREKILENL